MNTAQVKKPRPYWHVDAKWITGILLLLLLNITFFIYLLVQVTSLQIGVNLLSTALASTFSFSGGGLDAEGDLALMHQKIAAAPDGIWQPLPEFNIFVREADIAGLTPREARIWFFSQLAGPLYNDGAQGLADLSTDPEVQKSILESGIGPLGVISAASNNKLKVALLGSGLISLLFLGLLILFSYRFGRLGSPGCVIFLAAIPGLLLFGGLRGWIGQAAQAAPPVEQTSITRYTQLAVDILPGVIQSALQTYLALILVGIILILVALVGRFFFHERKNKEIVITKPAGQDHAG
jgi:hypothetical protein